MLCNSGWSWMFKARSMKKIRQREMLSDQFFTVGDLRWLTCCRTVGDHDPGMPNFLTKVRESDAERVRLGSGLLSLICNTSKSLLSVTWLFSSLSCTPDLFISFPVFQACIESCQRRRIGSPKWWGLPGLSKKKEQSNQQLESFAVFPGAGGASGIRGWWWDRGFQVASEPKRFGC